MAAGHAWCPAQCVILRMGASCKLSPPLNLYRALERVATPCTAQLTEPQQASELCTSSHKHTHTHTHRSSSPETPPADTSHSATSRTNRQRQRRPAQMQGLGHWCGALERDDFYDAASLSSVFDQVTGVTFSRLCEAFGMAQIYSSVNL